MTPSLLPPQDRRPLLTADERATLRRFAREGAPHPDLRVRRIAADQASAYSFVLFVGAALSGASLLAFVVSPSLNAALLSGVCALLLVAGFRQRRLFRLNAVPDDAVGER